MQTKFENLMQKIVENNEQLSFKKSKYNRAASIVTAKKVIDEDTLQSSLSEANSLDLTTGNKEEVKWGQDGITLTDNTVFNANSNNNKIKFTGAGIFVTSNGNSETPTWKPILTANGLEASMILGRLDVKTITISDSSQPRFLWNSEGLTAFGTFNYDTDDDYGLGYESTNYASFVRLNSKGLVFSNHDVIELSLGWDGLKINSQEGSVQITSNYGFQVFDHNGIERVQIGHLHDEVKGFDHELYGMQLKNIYGKKTLSTDSDGNLWLENVLKVGKLDDEDDSAGITSEEDDVTSIRFWAGGNRFIPWGEDGAPKLIITKSGDLYATNIYYSGVLQHITS